MFEHCIIELQLKRQKLIVCSGYRAPGNSPSEFLTEYETLLGNMTSSGSPILVGMDHNLDLLKESKHNPTKMFVEKYLDLNMLPCVTKATRITKSSATLIDNVFVLISLVQDVNSYITLDDMSDHLPILVVLKNTEIGEKPKHVVESRDLRPRNIKLVRNCINKFDWGEYLSGVMPHNDGANCVITQNDSINIAFNQFHTKLLDMVNEHVPFQTRTISEKSLDENHG